MVYGYTKPRGPIAASYTSPGTKYSLPNLVGYPNHDPRSPYQRHPAYSFGQKHGKLTDDSSPGPRYMPLDKVYRDGRDGSTKVSMHSRPTITLPPGAPGPGAYEANNSELGSKAPTYSFGLRYMERRVDDTPGPNAYGQGSMVGKTVQSHKKSAPSYSLYGRNRVGGFDEDLSKTPGPSAYGSTESKKYLKGAPSYSMGTRHQLPVDATQKPGPGAHSPAGMYNNSRRSAPTFSFGIRHTEYKVECITETDA